MSRCVQCTLPTNFPGVTFDAEGVCSLCAEYGGERTHIPSLEKLQAKFDDLIAQAKASSSHYHAVVAYSGGKDSTYLCYVLTREYGLNVLALTFDNGFIPRQTFTNMSRVLDNLGIDHLVFRPRGDVARRAFVASAQPDLYPMSLLRCGSGVCISCIRMVSTAALRAAVEKKIPLIMIGNSPGQLVQSENEIIYRDNWIPYEMRRRLFRPLAELVGDEVYSYVMLDKEEYQSSDFPHTVNPFPLIGYDEHVIYETITRLGWERPSDVDRCSTNCQLNAYGIQRHLDQLQFHPYDYEMAMLVRLGKIDRQEALRRLTDTDGQVAALAHQIACALGEGGGLGLSPEGPVGGADGGPTRRGP